ncbi:MAG: hypothetical protein ACK4GO_03905 [Gemmobacter sp.]
MRENWFTIGIATKGVLHMSIGKLAKDVNKFAKTLSTDNKNLNKALAELESKAGSDGKADGEAQQNMKKLNEALKKMADAQAEAAKIAGEALKNMR